MLSGRKAQAARNDEVILASARAVFAADPEAPIAAVAKHAHVGISALYRRYGSKDQLLQRLAIDAVQRYIDGVEQSLSDGGEPWSAFCAFMQRTVEASTSPLAMRLASPADLERARELTAQLLERTHAAGLRAEIEVADILLLLEMLHTVHSDLRQRYLGLLLDALHFLSLSALPGPSPSRHEIWPSHVR